MKKILLVLALVALVLSPTALARPSDDDWYSDEEVKSAESVEKKSSSSTSTSTSTTTTTTTTPKPVAAPAASSWEESGEEATFSKDSEEKSSSSTSTTTTSTSTSTTTTTTESNEDDPDYWGASDEGTHANHQSDRSVDSSSDTESLPEPLVFRSGIAVTHADFNQTCGDTETDLRCDPLTMVCSRATSRCECKDTDFIYVPKSRQCLQVSSRATSYSCSFDDQCRSAYSMGDLAFCNMDTRRCDCQTSVNGKEVIRVEDKCVYKKVIGEQCLPDDHRSCSNSMPGAVCMPKPPYYNSTHPGIMVMDPNADHVCWCDGSLVFDPTKPRPDECLPIRNAPGDECQFNRQCTQGLGPYSRCFTGSCQCADVVEQKGEAVFYKGTCYAKRALGDTCENELQCKASIHENAVCAPHASYLENEKVCHCPEGVACDDKGGAAVPVSGGLLFVMAAHLLLMYFGAFTVLN